MATPETRTASLTIIRRCGVDSGCEAGTRTRPCHDFLPTERFEPLHIAPVPSADARYATAEAAHDAAEPTQRGGAGRSTEEEGESLANLRQQVLSSASF